MTDITSARSYHERTKHHPGRYARSLGMMDWSTQPDPFRRFEGAEVEALERDGLSGQAPTLDAAYEPARVEAAEVDVGALARLLYDALAISAWKQSGPSRWPLRCNPSSGNLHPTEGYVVCGEVDRLAGPPGVHHYSPAVHGLERRRTLEADEWVELLGDLPAGVLVGLTSIHWRESWKYGERAFRYCQHDVGHAVACFAMAAGALGWHVRLLLGADDETIATLLGVSEQEGPEAEHPDLLMYVGPGAPDLSERCARWVPPADLVESLGHQAPAGTPAALSHGHHDWPVIDEAAAACVRSRTDIENPGSLPERPPVEERDIPARSVFRTRRSAQVMDGATSISREAWARMLNRMLPSLGRAPFDAFPWRPAVHPLFFVHRVEDVAPGVYVLVRDPAAEPLLREVLDPDFLWQGVPGLESLPLYCLGEGDLSHEAGAVSCHQSIAADGAFAVAMLAEFEARLAEEGEWFYRGLHWEAGALGQVMYLEAEAEGVRGTGIGCYFDDVTAKLAGIDDTRLQSIYHFTVGGSVEDSRLQTLPAYFHLEG